VTFSLREHGVDLVLLDIEGTTTPMSFVYDVLFPYARARLASYAQQHAAEEALRDTVATLRVEWLEDVRTGEAPPAWPKGDFAAAAGYLAWLMDRDRKSPSLKRIQGEIWETGFRDGALRGDLFSDVAPAFERWKASGAEIAIYSSGSVQAQRLIFGHASAGDLTPVISRFFDTAVGPKRSVESYGRIAGELGRQPQRILFVSDVAEELNAALDAGCQILLAVRPGNGPVEGPESLDAISSFDEIV